MISLKDYLSESSVLGNIEDAVSKSVDDILSVPERKDIHKCTGGCDVMWVCPHFINEYLPLIKDCDPENGIGRGFKSQLDPSKFDAVHIFIHSVGGHKVTHIDLCESSNCWKNQLKLEGVGGGYKSLTPEKNAVIEFINKLNDNPDNFKTLFEIYNKNVEHYKSKPTKWAPGSWDGIEYLPIETLNKKILR